MNERNGFLIIRVNPAERGAIDRLARAEQLPTSTMARRALLLAAQARGIYPVREMESGNRAQGMEAGGAVAE